LDLELFRSQLLDAIEEQGRQERFEPPDPRKVQIERKRKYARITLRGRTYGFIALATGRLHPPKNLKSPEKQHAGSIFDSNPLACCGRHSVDYVG
jgi:hypothetical protein